MALVGLTTTPTTTETNGDGNTKAKIEITNHKGLKDETKDDAALEYNHDAEIYDPETSSPAAAAAPHGRASRQVRD